MRSELIFRTQLTAQVKVSTIPFPFKHSLLEKQNLRFFFSTRFLFNFFRPNSIKIFYVLDYFLQTGLISAAVGLALKGFFFLFPALLSFALYRYYCLFVEFVRPDNGCKSPPLDPASTHHLPARDKVRCSLNYEQSWGILQQSLLPVAVPPPPARFP